MNAVEAKTAIITASPVALTAYAAVRATNRLSPASTRTSSSTPRCQSRTMPLGALG